jgi:D-glycero-alpha-D-manno-heptose-7-phosphate kinase
MAYQDKPYFYCMIITRTPFRISFVGGGSDLEAFYTRKKGAVISTTINRYMYISSHRFFEPDQLRVKYSKTETVSSVEELQHPILRVVLSKMGVKGGLEVSSIADVPAGTGMGSSSAFTVGLLHNLYAAQALTPGKAQLAAEACEVEINILQEPIGKQDQYAAAYGGLNLIEFETDGSVRVEPLQLPEEHFQALQDHLVLFYTGSQRSASAILEDQRKNTLAQKDIFGALSEMVDLVYELKSALLAGRLEEMGRLLHHNWQLKKTLSGAISSPSIEEAYQTALKHGAIGGKLLGAGGGGFLMFFCPPDRQARLIDALHPLRHFDCKFDTEGSKLIYYGEQY